jgi:hypothetical protein
MPNPENSIADQENDANSLMKALAYSVQNEISRNFSIELNFEVESIRQLEEIVFHQMHQEYLITGMTLEMTQTYVLALGAYIGQVLRWNKKCSWELDPRAKTEKKLDQNSAYLVTESGQQMFVCNWCYKRIVNGAGDNVWSKFQTALLLDEIQKNLSPKAAREIRVEREADSAASTPAKPLIQCPFCLEPAAALPEKGVFRECPICRHPLNPDLMTTPLAQMSREQRLRMIVEDMKFVLANENALLRSYKKWVTGYDPEYNEMQTELSLRGAKVIEFEKESRELLHSMGDLEDEANWLFARIAPDDLRLIGWMTQRRILRQKALFLSLTGASPAKIAAFQLELAGQSGWGSYGDSKERDRVLALLKARIPKSILEKIADWVRSWLSAKPKGPTA